ncbi:hydantoinase/oxoprolinase family protein [Rhizobium sp. GR12]|uniref:hydantoinase/oxoprolinase family protein n=1 Tax=Rhizobium sp. GR12 TaxID=3053925 RepID=UPI002FBE9CB7
MIQKFVIGIDVGGTFTDFVAIDEGGRTTIAKSPSTPADQSVGVLNGLRVLAEKVGMTLAELMGRTDRIVHGTTVATNALLERRGAKVGLLTSAGHRDILEMREGLKPDRYNLRMVSPEPLVPRDRRYGVPGRMSHDGRELTALDETVIMRQIEQMKRAGVSSVAVCYLHAYRNPDHERRTGALLEQHMPGAYVSLSSEVLPQIKEYERLSTTVVNSYVGPVVKNYFDRLRGQLDSVGYKGPLFIILSHGGICEVADATRLAAGTCLSGPAGGIAGARACARMIGEEHVIPFDMGGTSTEVSLIAGGEVALTSERGMAGERIALRSYDILSFASGGGSIAHVDEAGRFDVGPRSAGAVPGPAAYGKGGTEATVTDANLLLGYLDHQAFAGGLSVEAAEAAVDRLAATLSLSSEETAVGIHRLINVKMADGIRLMTLRKGVDPRRFTMLSFGGAAGLHAVEVAREMDVPRVVVPSVASVLCAWGMLASDLRYEMSASHVGDHAALDDKSLREIYSTLEAKASAKVPADMVDKVRVSRSAEMRYGEQIYEVDVALDGLDLDADGISELLVDRFHKRHKELYTFSSPGEEVDLVNARVAIICEVARNTGVEEGVSPSDRIAAPWAHRRIFSGGEWRRAPVYLSGDLGRGQRIKGPAVFESETTTIVIHEGDVATVDARGWLDIMVAPKVGVSAPRASMENIPAGA